MINFFQVSIILLFFFGNFAAARNENRMQFTFNYDAAEPRPPCIDRLQIVFYGNDSLTEDITGFRGRFEPIFYDDQSLDLIEQCKNVTVKPIIDQRKLDRMIELASNTSSDALLLKDQVIFYRDKNLQQQNGKHRITVTFDDFVPVDNIESLSDPCWDPSESLPLPRESETTPSSSPPTESSSMSPSTTPSTPSSTLASTPTVSNKKDSPIIKKNVTAAPLIQNTSTSKAEEEDCGIPIWVFVVLGLLTLLFLVALTVALCIFCSAARLREKLENLKNDARKHESIPGFNKLPVPTAEQTKSVASKSISQKSKTVRSGTKESVSSTKGTTQESKMSANIEASSVIPKTEEKLLPPTSNNNNDAPAPKTKSEIIPMFGPGGAKSQAIKTESQIQPPNVQQSLKKVDGAPPSSL